MHRFAATNGRLGSARNPRSLARIVISVHFVPVSDEIIRNHLKGNDPNDRAGRDFTIGVYPLLTDETCCFLAVDFDKSTWVEDARSFLETCTSYQVPAVLERSRSGNGGHVWIFFETPIRAVLVRKLGTLLLTNTMSRRPEIGMDSYDRLFPNQDTLPKGGFGNLIALPLQKKSREQNNSIFIDQDLNPYPDQWTLLSSIQKMAQLELERIVKNVQDEGEITGVRAVVLDENENEPWKLTPSRKYKEIAIHWYFTRSSRSGHQQPDLHREGRTSTAFAKSYHPIGCFPESGILSSSSDAPVYFWKAQNYQLLRGISKTSCFTQRMSG